MNIPAIRSDLEESVQLRRYRQYQPTEMSGAGIY